jgi:myo-inositol-1(or 4)-monophosphatase
MMRSWSGFDKVLRFAERLALQAGELLMQHRKRVQTLQVKSAHQEGLQTDADMASESFIRRALRRQYPKHGIVSEESKDHPGDEWIWVVDPLDGTHNYVHGHDDFSVSIGLTFRDEPVLGVVYLPARSEMFSAVRGRGAFWIRDNEYTRLELGNHLWPVGLLSVSSNIDFGAPECRAVVDKIQDSELFPEFRRRVIESSALELCHVARGIYDAHINFYAQPWDVMAGAVIVTEAGGLFSWIPVNEGRPHALASHRNIHDSIKIRISQA